MSLFIPFKIAFGKSNFKKQKKNSDEIVHFAYFDGLGQIFKNWLLHFQKLWQLWHCPQNWQKRFHLQSIRTKMSDNDEPILLLPKVHDLWPSHGMYPTLPKRSLEKISNLCWWQVLEVPQSSVHHFNLKKSKVVTKTKSSIWNCRQHHPCPFEIKIKLNEKFTIWLLSANPRKSSTRDKIQILVFFVLWQCYRCDILKIHQFQSMR